jgi:hypothetical protein
LCEPGLKPGGPLGSHWLSCPPDTDSFPMSSSKSSVVTIRIARPVLDKVRTLAAREGESQAVILRRLIRRALADRGAKAAA